MNNRHRGWRAEEAGGQYQAVFAVAPAGRGIGPAVNLNGSGGKINLGAHTQPQRRYDFISHRTTRQLAGSGSIIRLAEREAHELKCSQGLAHPRGQGGVVRASPGLFLLGLARPAQPSARACIKWGRCRNVAGWNCVEPLLC